MKTDLINRIQAQRVLFADKISRLDLKKVSLPQKKSKNRQVNVWRNHNFESIAEGMKSFLQYAGLSLEFNISDYDNSLSFSNWKQAELEIIWLDSSAFQARLTKKEWLNWLEQRLLALRALTNAPILVASWNTWSSEPFSAESFSIAGVYFADLATACESKNLKLIDARTAEFAGTPLARQAQLEIARHLGCNWLSGLLLPPIKALALDLDNTLHSGILGEDGIDGVSIEGGYKELQNFILQQKEKGIMLALVSRNEHQDVLQLFQERKDYPLNWDDFTLIEVSWGSKASAINKIAGQLNIATDAILFIDDNPGELVEVAENCTAVHLMQATTPIETLNALIFYPTLWRWKNSQDNAHRISDIKANQLRQNIKKELKTSAEYFESLGTSIKLHYNDLGNISRLAELCHKTNQFNAAIQRYNEADLQNFMLSPETCVASISLSDKLSESGTIAVIVAQLQKDLLKIKEICISCRALGRQLENDIIFSAIKNMSIFNQCQKVDFHFNEGARNQPARQWLEQATGQKASTAGYIYTLPAAKIADHETTQGIKLTKVENHG